EGILLRHPLALLGLAVPAITFLVEDLSIRVDPDHPLLGRGASFLVGRRGGGGRRPGGRGGLRRVRRLGRGRSRRGRGGGGACPAGCRGASGGPDGYQRRDLGDGGLGHAGLLEVGHRLVRAAGDDLLCRGVTDGGQGVELLRGGGVEVDLLPRRCRARVG